MHQALLHCPWHPVANFAACSYCQIMPDLVETHLFLLLPLPVIQIYSDMSDVPYSWITEGCHCAGVYEVIHHSCRIVQCRGFLVPVVLAS